jgi:hypothetical protein
MINDPSGIPFGQRNRHGRVHRALLYERPRWQTQQLGTLDHTGQHFPLHKMPEVVIRHGEAPVYNLHRNQVS